MPYHALYLNNGTGDFSASTLIKVPNGIGYGAGATFGVHTEGTQDYVKIGSDGGIFLDALTMDVNGDGHEDVVAIATRRDSKGADYIYYRGTRLQFLLNTPGSFAVDTGTRVHAFSHEPALNLTHYDTISAFDVDADGDQDLLLQRSTSSNFNPDALPNTRFLFNDGSNVFTDVTEQMFLPLGTYVPHRPRRQGRPGQDRQPVQELRSRHQRLRIRPRAHQLRLVARRPPLISRASASGS